MDSGPRPRRQRSTGRIYGRISSNGCTRKIPGWTQRFQRISLPLIPLRSCSRKSGWTKMKSRRLGHSLSTAPPRSRQHCLRNCRRKWCTAINVTMSPIVKARVGERVVLLHSPCASSTWGSPIQTQPCNRRTPSIKFESSTTWAPSQPPQPGARLHSTSATRWSRFQEAPTTDLPPENQSTRNVSPWVA